MKHILRFLFVMIACYPFFLQSTIYYEKPKDFHPTMEVVGCFLQYQDKFLMLHRQSYKPQGNRWGVPGGKLDKGESPLEAVIRETFEETHVDISHNPLNYLGQIYVKGPDGDFIFHLFTSKASEHPEEVKIAFKEHKGFTWVTPEEALQMNLMIDEETIIQMIYSEEN